jgi:hypothetical protein
MRLCAGMDGVGLQPLTHVSAKILDEYPLTTLLRYMTGLELKATARSYGECWCFWTLKNLYLLHA